MTDVDIDIRAGGDERRACCTIVSTIIFPRVRGSIKKNAIVTVTVRIPSGPWACSLLVLQGNGQEAGTTSHYHQHGCTCSSFTYMQSGSPRAVWLAVT